MSWYVLNVKFMLSAHRNCSKSKVQESKTDMFTPQGTAKSVDAGPRDRCCGWCWGSWGRWGIGGWYVVIWCHMILYLYSNIYNFDIYGICTYNYIYMVDINTIIPIKYQWEWTIISACNSNSKKYDNDNDNSLTMTSCNFFHAWSSMFKQGNLTADE